MTAVPEPVVRPTRYAVSCLPADDVNARHFTVWVAERGPDEWAVTSGVYCYDADGQVSYEPRVSEREDDWRARHRFDLGTALALAKRIAPTLTVNGYTVVDVLTQAVHR